uniref:arylsulfatase n=1 Tax=Candidatus Laterigemmans baculatus TaxID=2770505 RepID=UPI0028F45259|nr:arylsulfatase [Candidatus Laterigemmans baculatus]
MFAAIGFVCGDAASAAERPNVLLILADDLGYSDLGCYGGEIQTPNLDGLARDGVRFTQFYNTARCWPTRAALLTGFYAQQVRRDTVPGIASGGRGVRPEWAPLLAERLQQAGYRTYHSGKWHIDGMPLENGFDRSYYLQDQGRFFNPRVHYLDDQRLPAVEPGSDFYGTIAIADHAVDCLREHAEDHPERPFFHYLAFTAPHFPLHALPEDIARYRETYQRGWKELRDERWRRIRELGLVEAELSPVERELGPPYDFPEAIAQLGPGETNRPEPWGELTAEQQEFQATKMAIHAAMVDRMDREIGRVLEQLRASGALENTLILFLSDNGASAEIMVRDDGHDPAAPPGSAASYLCLGPGWSTVANTPFRRHKTWVHEGGIATPLIAHWPAGISAAGRVTDEPGHVIDLVPTILELTGLPPIDSGSDAAAPQLPGASLLRVLKGDAAEAGDAEPTERTLWWLHEGNRAIRAGDWKLVAAKGEPWELYDLSRDRTETVDLAAEHPERVRELEEQWTEMHERFVEDSVGGAVGR